VRPISTGFDGERIVAEEQLEYCPLPAFAYLDQDGTPVQLMRYTFTPAERAAIAAGDDLALSMPGLVAPHCLRLWGEELERHAGGAAPASPASDPHEFPHLEVDLRRVMDQLRGILPRGIGFTVMLFHYAKRNGLAYGSTAEREDVLVMLLEFLRKQDAAMLLRAMQRADQPTGG
jgi:hypothetical protein